MKIQKGNPIAFKSHKIERLDKAYSALIDIIKEYAEREDLTEEEIKMLSTLLVEAYAFKKAEYLIEDKFKKIGSFLNTAFCKAFDMDEGDWNHHTDLVYIKHKHTKQFLMNE